MKDLMLSAFLFCSIILIGCIQPKYGINAYDEQKNSTNYYLISYGGLTIPGKWNRDSREKNTNIYYLISPDSSNRLFITAGTPRRSFLGFSPYSNPYQYIKADILLSKNENLYDDSDRTFDIIQSDSVNNYLITKTVQKVGKQLTTQVIQLEGMKKRKLMQIGIISYKLDSINNPNIWDVSTQTNFIKQVF